VLAAQFEARYEQLRARGVSRHLTLRTVLSLHWRPMIGQTVWTLSEVAVRVSTPIILREFLRWIQSDGAGAPRPDASFGWGLAALIGFTGFCMAVIHHQLFWRVAHACLLGSAARPLGRSQPRSPAFGAGADPDRLLPRTTTTTTTIAPPSQDRHAHRLPHAAAGDRRRARQGAPP